MTKKRPLSYPDPRRAFFNGLALLLIIGLLFQWVPWDLDLAACFWSWSTGPWPGRDWAWSQAAYRYAEIPAYAWGVLGGVAFAASYHVERLRRWRGPGLFFFLLLLLGPGLLVNVLGKALTGRPRPSDLELFGGAWEFAKPWHFGVPGRGTSFPGGHASMAFYWLGLYFIPGRRAWRRWGLLFALGFGAWMSLARMAQGGHFLSDNLTSGALLFTLAAGLSPLIHWQPSPRFWSRPAVLGALGAALFGCLLLGQVTYEERNLLWARPGAMTAHLNTERLHEWQPAGELDGVALDLELQKGDLEVDFSAKDDGQRLPLRLDERFSALGLPGAKDDLNISDQPSVTLFKLDGSTLPAKVVQELKGLWWAVSGRYSLRLPVLGAVDARLKTAQGVLTIGHLPEDRQVLIDGPLHAQDLPLGFHPFGDHSWVRDGTQPQIALELSAPTIHFKP